MSLALHQILTNTYLHIIVFFTSSAHQLIWHVKKMRKRKCVFVSLLHAFTHKFLAKGLQSCLHVFVCATSSHLIENEEKMKVVCVCDEMVLPVLLLHSKEFGRLSHTLLVLVL